VVIDPALPRLSSRKLQRSTWAAEDLANPQNHRIVGFKSHNQELDTRTIKKPRFGGLASNSATPTTRRINTPTALVPIVFSPSDIENIRPITRLRSRARGQIIARYLTITRLTQKSPLSYSVINDTISGVYRYTRQGANPPIFCDHIFLHDKPLRSKKDNKQGQ
jgi:hypothetical protein